MFIKMKKKILLLISLSFSLAPIFSEPPEPPFPLPPPSVKEPHMNHRNFHGKRMIDEDIDFQLMFIKATKTPNSVLFELIFTKPVNPETVSKDNFLFNGKTLSVKLIRFSKNYRAINYFIEHNDFSPADQAFDLEIKNIESIGGEITKAVKFKNFRTDEEYRYLGREKEWKKF